MRFIWPIFVIIVMLLGYSCSSDFDVNDEWRAIPVVYCVLDPSQPVQYVKVTKAFLGDAPASEMAQISDSLFYNDVDVLLYEKTNGNRILIASFEATDTIPKPEGYFSNQRNTVFAAQVNLSVDKEYYIEVHINDIGVVVYNEEPVQLIKNCYISKPSINQTVINLSNYNSNLQYEYYTGSNGKVYQMVVKFHYFEVSGSDTSEVKTISWPQALRVDSLSNLNTLVKRDFSVQAFYNMVKENIPTTPDIKRFVKMPDGLEFHLTAADDNYYTYMQVSQPSTGLAQSKPLFTNVTNGIGLIAVRHNTQISKKLGIPTLDSLSLGIYTFDKGFAYHTDPYYAGYFIPGL